MIGRVGVSEGREMDGDTEREGERGGWVGERESDSEMRTWITGWDKVSAVLPGAS